MTSTLEVTDFQLLGDPSIAIAPLEDGRLGRRVPDFAPSDLTDKILRNWYYARRDQCLRRYRYQRADGTQTVASLVAPLPDLIVVAVRRVLTALIPIWSCLA